VLGSDNTGRQTAGILDDLASDCLAPEGLPAALSPCVRHLTILTIAANVGHSVRDIHSVNVALVFIQICCAEAGTTALRMWRWSGWRIDLLWHGRPRTTSSLGDNVNPKPLWASGMYRCECALCVGAVMCSLCEATYATLAGSCRTAVCMAGCGVMLMLLC
jgi:hypothetical protein